MKPSKETNFTAQICGVMRIIFTDRNTTNMFLFLSINLSFAFVEIYVGVWTNSLGLISDSFHMLFDCTGLVAGLCASVISKRKPNDRFSFGYVRAEVIAGLCNSLFLLFVGFFVLAEAFERALVETPEVKQEKLFVVAVLGFIVNLGGIYIFQHSNPLNGHQYQHHHNHQSNSLLMNAVFLHILADTLGSVAIILSTILMQTFGWMKADPICSILIALLIIFSVIPLINDSMKILMERRPIMLDDQIPLACQKVMRLHGVLAIKDEHFWSLTDRHFVGVVTLEVSQDLDQQCVVNNTKQIFRQIGVDKVYVQLELLPS